MTAIKNITDIEATVKSLAIGATATVGAFTVTRIPGGYIYNNSASSVFVPIALSNN